MNDFLEVLNLQTSFDQCCEGELIGPDAEDFHVVEELLSNLELSRSYACLDQACVNDQAWLYPFILHFIEDFQSLLEVSLFSIDFH